ncbi:hypothetical protein DINM_006733 [Dirofilaria immitis]|nr:hypothetical protein [Dirofilaria immitis]
MVSFLKRCDLILRVPEETIHTFWSMLCVGGERHGSYHYSVFRLVSRRRPFLQLSYSPVLIVKNFVQINLEIVNNNTVSTVMFYLSLLLVLPVTGFSPVLCVNGSVETVKLDDGIYHDCDGNLDGCDDKILAVRQNKVAVARDGNIVVWLFGCRYDRNVDRIGSVTICVYIGLEYVPVMSEEERWKEASWENNKFFLSVCKITITIIIIIIDYHSCLRVRSGIEKGTTGVPETNGALFPSIVVSSISLSEGEDEGDSNEDTESKDNDELRSIAVLFIVVKTDFICVVNNHNTVKAARYSCRLLTKMISKWFTSSNSRRKQSPCWSVWSFAQLPIGKILNSVVSELVVFFFENSSKRTSPTRQSGLTNVWLDLRFGDTSIAQLCLLDETVFLLL